MIYENMQNENPVEFNFECLQRVWSFKTQFLIRYQIIRLIRFSKDIYIAFFVRVVENGERNRDRQRELEWKRVEKKYDKTTHNAKEIFPRMQHLCYVHCCESNATAWIDFKWAKSFETRFMPIKTNESNSRFVWSEFVFFCFVLFAFLFVCLFIRSFLFTIFFSSSFQVRA